MAPDFCMPRSNRDPLVGTVVADRFHVKRVLASGAMGVVYVARDGGPKGPRIALKVAALKSGEVERILMNREAEALQRLQLPGVVRYITSGELDDSRPWIAMELESEASSLTTWARTHQVAGEAALGLIRRVGETVSEVHAAGVVHRDLKASNILVSGPSDDPRVILIDFGIARLDQREDPRADAPLLGGVHTSSPEQIRGESVEPLADQYSLAVLAYRLVTGRYPFHSKLPAEVLAGHLHVDVPPLPDDISEPAAAAIRRALSKNPADRYPDVRSFVAALEQSRTSAATEDPERRDVPWGWIVLGVLTVLAALYSVFGFA